MAMRSRSSVPYGQVAVLQAVIGDERLGDSAIEGEHLGESAIEDEHHGDKPAPPLAAASLQAPQATPF